VKIVNIKFKIYNVQFPIFNAPKVKP